MHPQRRVGDLSQVTDHHRFLYAACRQSIRILTFDNGSPSTYEVAIFEFQKFRKTLVFSDILVVCDDASAVNRAL
jgi:hypothetical protein